MAEEYSSKDLDRLFCNLLYLKKQLIFLQIYQAILRAYPKTWPKNWMVKMPKIVVLKSKWSFERGLMSSIKVANLRIKVVAVIPSDL